MFTSDLCAMSNKEAETRKWNEFGRAGFLWNREDCESNLVVAGQTLKNKFCCLLLWWCNTVKVIITVHNFEDSECMYENGSCQMNFGSNWESIHIDSVKSKTGLLKWSFGSSAWYMTATELLLFLQDPSHNSMFLWSLHCFKDMQASP